MLVFRSFILFFVHQSFAESERSPVNLEKRRFFDADDSLYSFLKYKQRKSSNKKEKVLSSRN